MCNPGGTTFTIHGLSFKYPMNMKVDDKWVYGGERQNNIKAAKGKPL